MAPDCAEWLPPAGHPSQWWANHDIGEHKSWTQIQRITSTHTLILIGEMQRNFQADSKKNHKKQEWYPEAAPKKRGSPRPGLTCFDICYGNSQYHLSSELT